MMEKHFESIMMDSLNLLFLYAKEKKMIIHHLKNSFVAVDLKSSKPGERMLVVGHIYTQMKH